MAKSKAVTRTDLDVDEVKRMAEEIAEFPSYVPPIYVGKIPVNKYCRGWNSKRGKYCEALAGQGTDHFGQGRCTFHGGSTPIAAGTYSAVARDTLKEHLTRLVEQTAEDVMDVREELDLMRALVAKRIEEYDDLVDALISWNTLEAIDAAAHGRKAKPQPIPQLQELVFLLDKIVKVKDTMHDQLHRDSIPRKDFFRLQDVQSDIVSGKIRSISHLIGDEEADRILNEIKDEWLEIKL